MLEEHEMRSVRGYFLGQVWVVVLNSFAPR